ncbi:MAG TPA: SOS response-associated peptidase [Xanthobacteraceae bacterium]|nr:SOS response-associated peptidase [Xanthobacteraceae bacterium]
MCGRAKLPDDVSELKLDLKIDWDEIRDYQPKWNAAPASKLPVVVVRDGCRTLTLMRWGLVPSWVTSRAKGLKIGRSTFNARAEGIDTRPAFRAAWKLGRRCLAIADAYYEWRDEDRQPFAVALSNRGPMTFAGLWDSWTAPDGEAIKSFTIITTTANARLQPLHGRMPVLLTPENWAGWLGETTASDTELKAMLKPYPGAGMAFWPVERRIGNSRNDNPDLFTPRS